MQCCVLSRMRAVCERAFDTRGVHPYHCRPMSTGASKEAVRPYELGAREAVLKARIPLESFERLTALLLSGDGELAVVAQFALDEHRRCRISGEVAGTVRLNCQGCAEDMDYELRHEIVTTLVRSDDEAKALMPATDVLVVEEDEISLVEILEDELILTLPEVVCGRFDTCPNRPRLAYGAAEELAESPFSGLSDLMKAGPNRPVPTRRD